jgi:hypothetical protein
LHEQFGYAYDKAWNLDYRTNDALIEAFGVNNLNELTTNGHSGTLTITGTATEKPASGVEGRRGVEGVIEGVEGVSPEWRLDKVTSFSYICCGAAFLSSDDVDDLAFERA